MKQIKDLGTGFCSPRLSLHLLHSIKANERAGKYLSKVFSATLYTVLALYSSANVISRVSIVSVKLF